MPNEKQTPSTMMLQTREAATTIQNRGVTSMERKLQEFQESMDTFPKDAQDLLAQIGRAHV